MGKRSQQQNGLFPQVRLRRLRRTGTLRSLVQEVSLLSSDLVFPMFVVQGQGVRASIEALPGQVRLSPDLLPGEIAEIQSLGVRAVLLFGIPSHKDSAGAEAYKAGGVVQEAIRVIKQAAPELVVMTDVCLCEYTDHGHCGTLTDSGEVDNDATLALLERIAVSHAVAGADVVSPSAMMDGQVQAIRIALDGSGFSSVAIMAYGAKFASSFYGPFREAVGSSPQFGDRRSYQMDGANSREALRELEQDAAEGADILMVKPALAYLDVLTRARSQFDHPLAAYNVSGEYAMLKAATAHGWLNGNSTILEVLTSIKRAGADLIFTYHAKEAARLLQVGQ